MSSNPAALDEYREAAHYYARRQPDLDLRFVTCIEDAIALILEDPYRWRPVEEDMRRCLTWVFPFGILYTIELATALGVKSPTRPVQ